MPGNVNSQTAQLLNQTPDLRAAGPNLRCDLRPADNNRCVGDKQTHDTTQSGITLQCGRSCPRTSAWRRFLDAGIMRDEPTNSNRSVPIINGVRPEQRASSYPLLSRSG